ncbi:MAG: ATP-binding cassette domain-containing protein [Candidatus Krumholzibacteriota bacterium]|nr:ATP-binding cassette domain-containing protein [Candidatus Krumholzibacteriota bacterium]
MITVDGISKSYGSQELFRQASFKLTAGERLGLVGRNGSGKSTLFRLITGEEEPDAGQIVVPKNYAIGCVDQSPSFAAATVLEEGCAGLAAAERDQVWKVEKVLAGLGFTAADMRRPPGELSGGFQVRLNLAKALVREYDLLLLDEPNNYLDITSIRWLTSHLREWRGELILVTHDRAFMDHVATHTMAIYRKTLRKIRGDTGKLYDQLAQEEEVYEKTRLNDEKKRRKAELFIRRFRAKARLAGMVQSRIKSLEKQEKLERLEQAKDLDFSFSSRPFNGKPVLNVTGLSFGYDAGSPLFDDLSFSVGPWDRLCVVGPNGKGKTTLLKILAGRLAPDGGEISYNPTVATAWYEQTNVSELSPERTVVEEILAADPAVDGQRARNIAGMMMFEGDAALKKIRVLSGGEKSRVMLGRIIATPVNVLLLDEPTNHLDMESCDALLEALNAFEGAIVMVTHNEMLLDGLAERLVVFRRGGARLYEGSYSRFLDAVGWEEAAGAEPDEAEEKRLARRVDRKEMRRRRSEFVRERSRSLRPLEKEIEQLETAIVEAEAELETLHEAMAAAVETGDGERIAGLSKRTHACRSAVEESFERLERAHAVYEEEKRRLDGLLDALGDDA